jgi:Family of unknown function (DUF6533)
MIVTHGLCLLPHPQSQFRLFSCPMEAAIIDAIVQYLEAERQIADVSNIYVHSGDQTFDILSSTLLVRLSSGFSYRVTDLTSVWPVSAIVLVVCYFFALSDASKADNYHTKLYDYVLTVSEEINPVWFAPWNHVKFLFIFVRYIPFASLYPLFAGLTILILSADFRS